MLAPMGCLLLGALALLPNVVREWRDADDKGQLILHRWIRNRGNRL